MGSLAEWWYRLSEAIDDMGGCYAPHWLRARIRQRLADACGWIGRRLDR
jgi:hypothetical protein